MHIKTVCVEDKIFLKYISINYHMDSYIIYVLAHKNIEF